MDYRKSERWTIEHEHLWLNCLERVQRFFDDPKKAELWMRTENPMLGDMSPNGMIAYDRYARLVQFIQMAETERGITR